MASDLAVPKPGWAALLREHARLHTPAALGLGLALIGVLALLVQSLVQLAGGNAAPGLRLAMLGGMAAFATTALGTWPRSRGQPALFVNSGDDREASAVASAHALRILGCATPLKRATPFS